ncbi:hypothetical protein [Streptomyces sp. MMG1121]|uniref:hypothetical protein n=1 Tax=Streptomyces sp. MMG1121 TaxID=1415544 RepID=UPI000A55B217|nr:hypothetical protein [Streptomyces sp. MMG1121]
MKYVKFIRRAVGVFAIAAASVIALSAVSEGTGQPTASSAVTSAAAQDQGWA